MPALPSPATALQRWQQGTAAAGARYTQGVQNSNDWAGATVAALPAMQAGIQAAIADGRIGAGIQRVGTAGWRTQTVAKAANWQTGVSSPMAAQNYQAGYQKLSGFITTAQAAIASMPRGGYAENRQRALTFMDSMHASKLANP